MSKPESLTTSETASATSSASSVRERGASDGDAAAQAEQRERRKPRRVDDQAAPVRTQTAPADDDERGERDNREQRQLDERTECERRREQQRLDLVCEPEETLAAFGVRAERRERDGRRRGAEEDGVGGEQTGQGERERAGGTGRERKRQQPGERGEAEDEADQDAGAELAREVRRVQACVHLLELSRRVLSRTRGQDRLLALLERAHGRCHVADRDKSRDPGRAREEQAVIAATDDCDRITVEIVVLAGRRERDVDRHRRRRASQRDQGLSLRLSPEQGVLELAARQRGERRRAAHARAGSRNHRADRTA